MYRIKKLETYNNRIIIQQTLLDNLPSYNTILISIKNHEYKTIQYNKTKPIILITSNNKIIMAVTNQLLDQDYLE